MSSASIPAGTLTSCRTCGPAPSPAPAPAPASAEEEGAPARAGPAVSRRVAATATEAADGASGADTAPSECDASAEEVDDDEYGDDTEDEEKEDEDEEEEEDEVGEGGTDPAASCDGEDSEGLRATTSGDREALLDRLSARCSPSPASPANAVPPAAVAVLTTCVAESGGARGWKGVEAVRWAGRLKGSPLAEPESWAGSAAESPAGR